MELINIVVMHKANVLSEIEQSYRLSYKRALLIHTEPPPLYIKIFINELYVKGDKITTTTTKNTSQKIKRKKKHFEYSLEYTYNFFF